uniref:Uncharacterized protein n=1 Tax=Babesia bovis TaxID=5865 RepID=S6C7N8_BABBO|nr:hypothetical protein [Babesia bovis]BAN64866.1 hypothetical protein [Babesia bovis]
MSYCVIYVSNYVLVSSQAFLHCVHVGLPNVYNFAFRLQSLPTNQWTLSLRLSRSPLLKPWNVLCQSLSSRNVSFKYLAKSLKLLRRL